MVSNEGTMKRSLLCLLLIAASRCAATSPSTADSEDIREAVFRYQFQHNASGQQQAAKVYCLSIGAHQDPSNELMKRFANNNPPVRKVSVCDSSRLKGVIDKQTPQGVLIFRVESISFRSVTEATVTGGYYEGPDSSSGNTYTVRKVNGAWKVVEDKMNWIS